MMLELIYTYIIWLFFVSQLTDIIHDIHSVYLHDTDHALVGNLGIGVDISISIASSVVRSYVVAYM